MHFKVAERYLTRRDWKELRLCVDNLLALYGNVEVDSGEPSQLDLQQIDSFIKLKLLAFPRSKVQR